MVCTAVKSFVIALAFLAAPALAQVSDPSPPESAATPELPSSELPSLAELQAQGAIIGDIRIANVNVFDTDDPAEDVGIFRLANRLHIRTRPNVIRQQLLFQPGEPLSVRKINESERLLRGNRYLAEADIKPVRYVDGVVDLEVRTQDVWTLNPGISLSRSGGKNSYSFSVQESNLLGYGKDVMMEFESDIDRSTSLFHYSDPHLWGTWNQLVLRHADNSDGNQSQIALAHPFYSLNSPWAASVGALHWERTDSRYNLGEIVDQFHREQRSYQGSFGLSSGLKDGSVRRWSIGAVYESNRFEPDPVYTSSWPPPASKTLVYPFAGFEFLQDRYEERRNEAQIGRTEDIYAGVYFRGTVGWASPSWGADRNAAILSLAAGGTLESADRSKTLAAAVDVSGRLEHRRIANGALTLDVESYWRITPHQLIFGSLFGVATQQLDRERQVLLGGDFAGINDGSSENATSALATRQEESLRGYPLRYQDGRALALVTLEHRIFTEYYLLRLFRVGGAVFFDAGRTWGRGTAGGVSQGWLKDVGFGLRLGSSRSAFGNVIHFDVAFPLDGDPSIDQVQFLVQTKRSF